MNVARTLVLHHADIGFLRNIVRVFRSAHPAAEEINQRAVIFANHCIHRQRRTRLVGNG